MRALVVGLGRMGRFHARALHDLELEVTTFDPAPAVGADHQTPPAGWFDVVCVATPISVLAETAAWWAARAGRMLVEKPFAVSAGEAQLLADSLDGRDVTVGFVERFNPQVRLLADDTGWRRDMPALFTRHNPRASVDVQLDLATHDADLARHLEVTGPVSFSTRDRAAVMRRSIRIHAEHGPRVVNLTAHTESPLHHQWADVLGPAQHAARPADAIAALTMVEARDRMLACA